MYKKTTGSIVTTFARRKARYHRHGLKALKDTTPAADIPSSKVACQSPLSETRTVLHDAETDSTELALVSVDLSIALDSIISNFCDSYQKPRPFKSHVIGTESNHAPTDHAGMMESSSKDPFTQEKEEKSSTLRCADTHKKLESAIFNSISLGQWEAARAYLSSLAGRPGSRLGTRELLKVLILDSASFW